MHAVGLVLVGQVEEDAVGQVKVDLLRQLGLLPLLAQHTLLTPRLLGLVQSLWEGGVTTVLFATYMSTWHSYKNEGLDYYLPSFPVSFHSFFCMW